MEPESVILIIGLIINSTTISSVFPEGHARKLILSMDKKFEDGLKLISLRNNCITMSHVSISMLIPVVKNFYVIFKWI